MDELTTMKRPPNPLGSSITESKLQRISNKVMKKEIEVKKVELKQSGTKIPAKDVDVLRFIDASDLYGLINDGINKYNDCNTVQGFINDMFGNTGAPNKLGKSEPVVVYKQPC